MQPREILYVLANMNEVSHATLNPEGLGSVRIHLVPPKFSLTGAVPSLVFINGHDIIPINLAWAILLNNFIKEVNRYSGKEIDSENLKELTFRVVRDTRRVYPHASSSKLKKDLFKIIEVLVDIAFGRKPSADIGMMSIGEYAPYMKAPHRMDLMVSAMEKDGKWHCNQKCLHCYAAGQSLSKTEELSTSQWKSIIEICQDIGIPQLTFTGGEPTMRDDLPELIKHARWFVTRVNTNGIRLTRKYAQQLMDADLDSIQITYYSADADVHNQLVGGNHHKETTEGIKNALAVGLSVSINTPLCTINRDYVKTLKFLHELGVTYVSCSGLIITGNACRECSKETQLSQEELLQILKDAVAFCKENHMEISFTSPGWLPEEEIKKLGLDAPTCGACLSNMGIDPGGNVIPCQSWLSDKSLGNILVDSWKSIWNSERCKKIRDFSTKQEGVCPLRKGEAK